MRDLSMKCVLLPEAAHRSWVWAVLFGGLVLAACGGSGSSPGSAGTGGSGEPALPVSAVGHQAMGGSAFQMGGAAPGVGGASSSLGGQLESAGGGATLGGGQANSLGVGGRPMGAGGGNGALGSSLKGFVYGDDPRPLSSTDPTLLADKLAALHVDWFYTWGRLRTSQVPLTLPFSPMIWGHTAYAAETQDHMLAQLSQPGVDDVLLGFNEPDRADQANYTVEEALALWPDLMTTGRRLGSPATAENALTGAWFPAFMQGVKDRGLRVDFVCIHRYASDNPQALLDYLDALYATYKLPIWITEFAVADWNATASQPNKYTSANVQAFMRAVVPGLRQRKFVERFAWKTRHTQDVNMGSSALFKEDGSLTEVGITYAGL